MDIDFSIQIWLSCQQFQLHTNYIITYKITDIRSNSPIVGSFFPSKLADGELV